MNIPFFTLPRTLTFVATLTAVAALPFIPSWAGHPSHPASVHVAVLSVTPFNETLAKTLQPTFDLDSTKALDKAIAQSGAYRALVRDSFMAAASVGSASPDAPKKAEGGPAPEKPEKPKTDSSAEIDPMLNYRAATALFEEVKLLNRSLEDAPGRKNYDPFVVRVQVSLMPATRNDPNDALTNLTFFSGKDPFEEYLGKNENLILDAAPGAHLPLSPDAPRRQFARDNIAKVFDAVADNDGRKVPIVIPLLVTDSVESAVGTLTQQSLMEVSAQAGGKLAAHDAKGMLNKSREMFDEYSGSSINSLLTVGRVSENTVRVRLGAVRQSTNSYVMVAQTHYVTLLLLVPKGESHLNLVARTTFVDSDGNVNNKIRDHNWKTELDEQGDKYRWTKALSHEDVSILMFWARDGLYPQFVNELHAIIQSEEFLACFEAYRKQQFIKENILAHKWPEQLRRDLHRLPFDVLDDEHELWTDLNLLDSGAPYSFVDFELPAGKKPVAEWRPID